MASSRTQDDMNRLLRTACSSIILAVTLCFVPCQSVVGADREPPGFLASGDLETASQSPEDQARVIGALTSAARHTESLQTEGDFSFASTLRSSDAEYESTAARASAIPRSAAMIISLPDRSVFVGPTAYRERWAYNGVRVLYHSEVVPKPEHPDPVADNRTAYYDGARVTAYFPLVNSAIVGSPDGLSARMPWLTMKTVWGNPLSDLLGRPGAVYEGRQSIGDTSCHKVRVPVSGQFLEVWVDPEHGYRAVRVVTSQSSGDYGITEVQGFKEIAAGSWFPTKGKYGRYHKTDTGDFDMRTTLDWSLTSDAAVAPVTLFEPHFPAGTKVTDMTVAKPISYVIEE